MAIVLYVSILFFGTVTQLAHSAQYPEGYAGINLFVFAQRNIPLLLGNHGYLFVLVACIDFFRKTSTYSLSFRIMLKIAWCSMSMLFIANVIILAFFTVMTGRFHIDASFEFLLWQQIRIQSLTLSAALSIVYACVWGCLYAILGYVLCCFLKNWQLIFSIISFYFDEFSQIWFRIWNGGVIGSIIPVSKFGLLYGGTYLWVEIKQLIFAISTICILSLLYNIITKRRCLHEKSNIE